MTCQTHGWSSMQGQCPVCFQEFQRLHNQTGGPAQWQYRKQQRFDGAQRMVSISRWKWAFKRPEGGIGNGNEYWEETDRFYTEEEANKDLPAEKTKLYWTEIRCSPKKQDTRQPQQGETK